MLCECGYIRCPEINKGDTIKRPMALDDITSITYQGHKFLESIKPQPIWDKTKSIISKIGSHALEFVEETAQMVAVESAKQVIKSTMGDYSLNTPSIPTSTPQI